MVKSCANRRQRGLVALAGGALRVARRMSRFVYLRKRWTRVGGAGHHHRMSRRFVRFLTRGASFSRAITDGTVFDRVG